MEHDQAEFIPNLGRNKWSLVIEGKIVGGELDRWSEVIQTQVTKNHMIEMRERGGKRTKITHFQDSTKLKDVERIPLSRSSGIRSTKPPWTSVLQVRRVSRCQFTLRWYFFAETSCSFCNCWGRAFDAQNLSFVRQKERSFSKVVSICHALNDIQIFYSPPSVSSSPSHCLSYEELI